MLQRTARLPGQLPRAAAAAGFNAAGDADNNGGGANSMRLPFLHALRKKFGYLVARRAARERRESVCSL